MALTNATTLADYGSGIGTQGATLKVDANNQRVGIGSTLPTTTLDVTGNMAVSGNIAIAGTVTYEDITNVDAIGLSTFRNGLRVTGGSVGIGTDAPVTTFEAFNSGSGESEVGRFTRKNGSDNHGLRIKVDPDANTVTYTSSGAASGHHIFATTGSNEVVRITSAGNAGIGTVSPTTRLHVLDTTKTSTTARDNTVARFVTNASNADCNIQLSNGIDHSAQLGIVGNGAEFYIAQDGVEKLRIDSNGLMGLGTTPEAWSSGWKVFETGGANIAASGASSADIFLTGNAYYDGSWKYKSSGVAKNIYMNTDGIVFRQAASGSADATISWTESARFNTSGNLAFPSGQGIDFSATTDGTGTASSDLLDDYEEGTFTPTVASTSVNVSYSNQEGYYTKVGNMVHFSFQINISGVVTNGSGDFTIGGLPYSASGSAGRYVIQTSSVNFDSTGYDHYAYLGSATTLKVLKGNDNAGWTVVQVGDFSLTTGSIITLQGTYRTPT